jgi:carnitine 3-dehydrogenase
MGPTLLFHLGGDEGGLAAFCERYADSFNRWWDDLGDPRLDAATATGLVDGLSTALAGESIETLAARRDQLLTTVVAATHGTPTQE